MKALPFLDAHTHINPAHTSSELAESGAVLAMTVSLEGAALAFDRRDPSVGWVGLNFKSQVG